MAGLLCPPPQHSETLDNWRADSCIRRLCCCCWERLVFASCPCRAIAARPASQYLREWAEPRWPTVSLKIDRKTTLQHKAVPYPELWDFAYSTEFTRNISASEIASPLLKQQQEELKKLAKRSILERSLELSEIAQGLQELAQQYSSFSTSLQAETVFAEFEKWHKGVFAEARKGGIIHFADAEMHWLYYLLHDDALRDSLRLRYMGKPGPIVFHLLVTKAPCDHCSHMMVAKHQDLVTRFERDVELVICAKSAYDGHNTCVGLEEIGKQQKWLTYKRLWQEV